MTIAVLTMAYGSPNSMDEVEAYFTDIRGGRRPTPEALEGLIARYARIGGPSTLSQITRLQASSLEDRLNTLAPGRFEVFVGMKHWHPYVSEAVEAIAAKGIKDLIGLVLAPHYSTRSVGQYRDRIDSAMTNLDAQLRLEMISSWFESPKFIDFSAANLMTTLNGWPTHDPGTRVFFTAHSLPESILADGDPYKDQLQASAKLIADAAGIGDWEVAWQSASPTHEPWIGPDILDSLAAFKDQGGRRALVAPIGFVADHLEILYDVDVECVERAEQLGIEFRRTPSPNTDPRFIDALAEVVFAASRHA
ncbi:MAG TPA: ferrochelatase [Actinomycetota bacterium]|nr:ferrochelatase [Actinomycetota bacterium]